MDWAAAITGAVCLLSFAVLVLTLLVIFLLTGARSAWMHAFPREARRRPDLRVVK
jgi:hypothetical protein